MRRDVRCGNKVGGTDKEWWSGCASSAYDHLVAVVAIHLTQHACKSRSHMEDVQMLDSEQRIQREIRALDEH